MRRKCQHIYLDIDGTYAHGLIHMKCSDCGKVIKNQIKVFEAVDVSFRRGYIKATKDKALIYPPGYNDYMKGR